jgi:hypothetical protein
MWPVMVGSETEPGKNFKDEREEISICKASSAVSVNRKQDIF